MRFLILLFLPFAAIANESLVPYEAEYKVKFSVFGGRLTTSLVRDEGRLRARHALETTGMSKMLASGVIEELAVFSEKCGELVPEEFSTTDELTKEETSAAVVFSHDDMHLTGTVDGQDVRIPFEDPTFDRVSIQYQLMSDLARKKPASVYRMYDIDETKVLSIENIGTRRIKTRAGDFDAIGIRHQSEGSSRTTTFWMVEELGFAPALIEQHRKGKLRLKATLTDYRAL